VRKTARRLGIQTDSTKRFENDLSPVYVPPAMLELSALVVEMFGEEAVFENVVDVYKTLEKYEGKRNVAVSQKDINRILGADFDLATITTAVLSLGFDYSETNGIFQIFVPPARLDLNITEDLVEEVGRVMGYDKVVPVMPKINTVPKINKTFAKILSARKFLLEKSYSEVMTYTFVKKGEVEVARGSKGKSHLRTNLTDGVKESFEANKLASGILGMDDVRIFEIGNVFVGDAEVLNIAVADKNGVNEKTLDEFIKENNLDISVYNFSGDYSQKVNGIFKQWSAFPFITRDVAVFLPNEVDRKELEDILESAKLLARAPRLVDVYQKDYETSYAYRLIFQSHEKTLTDEEVAPVMGELYKKIGEKGWTIR